MVLLHVTVGVGVIALCKISPLFRRGDLVRIVFGSIATLLGTIGTRLLRKHPYFAWIPPVVSNMAIIPVVLQKVYNVPDAWWYLVITVGIGEIISCGVLGIVLYQVSCKVLPNDLRN